MCQMCKKTVENDKISVQIVKATIKKIDSMPHTLIFYLFNPMS